MDCQGREGDEAVDTKNSWMRKRMEYFPLTLAVPEVVQVEAPVDGAPVISDMEEGKRKLFLLLFAFRWCVL